MAAEFQDPTLNEQWHDIVPSMTLGKMLEARKHSQPSRKRRKTFVPRTPFMLFVNEVLEKIANDNPDVGPDSIVDLVEQKWKALADAERDAFAEKSELEYKAAADATALAASNAALSKRRKRNTPIKEVAMPKHPKSAYLHFAALNRDRVKESVSSFAEVAKQLGLRWKSIPDDEREVFCRMAEADKLRYRTEKSRYDLAPVKTVESPSASHPVDAQAAAEPAAADVFSGKRRPKHPKAPKHPLSAYLFFVAMHRGHLSARYSDCSFQEVARILGSVWKRVPALEKRKYEILAEADKRNYKFEMHEWNGQAADLKSSGGGGTSATSHRERQPKQQQRRQRQQEHKYKQQQLSPGARDAAQAIADLASSVTDSTKPDPPPRNPRPDASATTTTAAAAAAKARRRTLLMYHRDASRVVAGNIVEQSSDASSRARAMALLSSKAFAFFSSSERDAVLQVHPHVDAEELEAALQQMWNELSEHEKTPYMKEAERLLLDDSASAAVGGAGAGALPVREWDAVRLGRFVEELGFPAHARSFERLRITGSDVAGLSTSRMKTEIGIRKLGERKRIKAAFDELLQQQQQQFDELLQHQQQQTPP